MLGGAQHAGFEPSDFSFGEKHVTLLFVSFTIYFVFNIYVLTFVPLCFPLL